MGIVKHSVGDALFSKVQQRVLALFFGEPERSFHTNEIIRLTNSGTGAVQRELAKLFDSGLITVKQVGNQKQYQVNREAYIFSELQSIILKTFGVSDIVKESLEPMASKIHIAFIYGSIAKQQDKVSSDIDLMIIGDNISYPEIYVLLESCQLKLGRQINPTFYSKEEWLKKSNECNNFILQILKQPKIFIIGSENELVATG